MRLVIDDYGAFLKKKGRRLVVVSGEKREEYASDKVEQVLILRGAALSIDAVELAIEKGIDIVCLDRVGKPFARIYPCRLGGTTLTRRNQLVAQATPRGTALAKAFVRAKLENMGGFLKSLGKSRRNAALKEVAERIMGFSERIERMRGSVEEVRNVLLGVEGEASKLYFCALSEVLSPGLYTGTRSRRPPRDVFNAYLSYGYGVLYAEVERACIISGLDPYLGFLHTDRYGKPSMALDLIEEFRQAIVDRTMVTLAARRRMGEGDVEKEEGVYLNKEGRAKAIEAVVKRFDTEVRHRGKRVALRDVILRQAREVVRFLNGERRVYSPYIHRW